MRGPPARQARRYGCGNARLDRRSGHRNGSCLAFLRGKRGHVHRHQGRGGLEGAASHRTIDSAHSVGQARSAEAKPNHGFFTVNNPREKFSHPRHPGRRPRHRRARPATTIEAARTRAAYDEVDALSEQKTLEISTLRR